MNTTGKGEQQFPLHTPSLSHSRVRVLVTPPPLFLAMTCFYLSLFAYLFSPSHQLTPTACVGRYFCLKHITCFICHYTNCVHVPVLSVPTDDPQLLVLRCSLAPSLLTLLFSRPGKKHARLCIIYAYNTHVRTTSRAWILRTLRGCPSSPPGRRRRSPPTARKGRRWPPRSSSAPPQETRLGRQAFFFFCYVCISLGSGGRVKVVTVRAEE